MSLTVVRRRDARNRAELVVVHPARCQTHAMQTEFAEPDVVPPDTQPSSAARPWRAWLIASIIIVLVLAGTGVLRWHRSTSPSQFATLSAGLGAVTAPSGAFSAYNPTFEQTGPVLATPNAWTLLTASIWTNTADPHWWVSVRGWQISVNAQQQVAACREMVAWLNHSGRQLKLGRPAGSVTAASCERTLNAARTQGGTDAGLAGVGRQTSDGRARYGVFAEAMSGPKPDQVTLLLVANASVSNP